MKISVLMSIYNESDNQIRESVESILNQTFTEFEFIIIIDNPKMVNVKEILDSYHDERIKYVFNKKNIGLAMSMNKASKIATGKYYARMDADDISAIDRLAIEYEYLEKNVEIDLVCSTYHYIDENGQIANFICSEIDFNYLEDVLPLINMIHHPTIMIKSSLFHELGGYRDFPCTQDYDLWLRMLFKGCKMQKIENDLLSYRIRLNSTWKSNGMKQQAIFFYIRSLYKERCEKGVDSFNTINLDKYLSKVGVGTSKEEKYNYGKKKLLKAKDYLKQGNYYKTVLYFIWGIVQNSFLVKEVFYKIYMNYKLKKYFE